MVNLQRVAARAALPLRKTSKMDMKPLGSYPVPPEEYKKWEGRSQCQGGEIHQSISSYQQKIMWNWFQTFPARWYGRFSAWAWSFFWPALVIYGIIEKCKYDVDKSYKAKHWY
eukprot:GDKI01037452.1.p1 GENE.GDKI01037452.1~~GDKI01037452.1.p1  ORF type:complete len:113 (+),score=21.10 GDKI01037452.1:64-402(+)